ncbi:FIST N-terminal domain-containing protein [Telmatospirillum sp.]|uniref:FIST signal transduction protein n=1 Tax=Telmatospirillum sp. TaxID=2079197 RepID=UPI0028493F5F|nr:FIST N-terminal domain-containing protein [Telmatospirillum sp.]MDR3440454.1 FIST N-terminal domain-containing protein [Telmatospirillum sp.]
MTSAFRAGLATGGHWGLAAKACLQQIAPLPAAANLGFVYVTEDFSDSLSSIVTYLREVTGIACWLGGVGFGVFGSDAEVHQGAGLSVMVGEVDASALRPFDQFDASHPEFFLAAHGSWLADQSAVTALVHGSPRDPQIAKVVVSLAKAGQAFLVGGLTAGAETPDQVCGRVADATLSGLLLGDGIPLATGLTQGCSPIGGEHRITEALDDVIMELDGAPALQALKADAGDIIARDLKRAAGYIHVARPIEGSDRLEDYVVHSLVAIDPRRGWLAITGGLATGEKLIFVRRHPQTAQRDLQEMLAGLASRLNGRTIRGGIYVSGAERNASLFGDTECESAMIRETLGHFPLVGFSTDREICHDRVYCCTGVLTLFV